MKYTETQIELVKSELTAVDLDAAYDEMLDEAYGMVNIAGLEYSTSHALKEIDPVAYRVGMSDYSSDLEQSGHVEIDGEYYLESDVEELIERVAEEQAETNLEKAQVYFKRADFDMIEDKYILDGRFEIEWTGEGENFVVNEGYEDRDVGYVSNPEMFAGDFDQCLKFVVNLTGGAK